MQKFNKKTFKKLATANFDEKFQKKKFLNTPIKGKRRQSNLDSSYYKNYGLNELQEQNEEFLEEEEEEDIQDISFELSNVNDMGDLLDNFSNKSDDKIELEFESTKKEEGIELIEEYLKESTKQIFENKKGLDKDAVNISKEFYSNLVNNLSVNDLNKNINLQRYSTNKDEMNSINDIINNNSNNNNYNNYNSSNIEKFNSIKRKSYKESKGSIMISESYTSDDNTPKIKNYYLGQNTKTFVLKNKNRSSSKFIREENDEKETDKDY